MKFNFKKIVPIAIGAVLLGSTIGFAGALAADVSYPNDFADSVVVIGAAGAADTVAANMIANDLGKLTTGVQTAVSDGWLAKKGSTELYINGDIESIDNELDSSDLPGLLTDTTYKDNKGTNKADYDTEETITFANTADTVVFATPSKGDNKDKRGTYLKLLQATTTPALNYTIEFPTGVKIDNSTTTTLKDDLRLTKLKMLGKEWTINDATGLSGTVTKITMLGGAEAATMTSGETKSFVVNGKTYSVTVTVRTDDVAFDINGETLSLAEDEIDELSDGTQVGVTKISTSSKESVADSVEFYIGADKIVLEDGQEVELNNVDVDNTLVDLRVDTTNKELDAIAIAIAADEDTWVGTGKDWKDTVFGAVKLVFAGLDKKTETITFKGGSDGSVTFLNSKGTEIAVPLSNNDSDVVLGDGNMDIANISALGKYRGLKGGNMLAKDGDYCFSMSSLEDCEGLMLLVTDSSGERRIIELNDVDLKNSKMTFKDLTADSEKEISFTNSTNEALDLGFATIYADINQTMDQNKTANTVASLNNATVKFINFTLNNGVKAKTSLDGQIVINNGSLGAKDLNVVFYNGTNDGSGILGSWNLSYDTTDEEIQIKGVTGPTMAEEDKGSDWNTGIDTANYGALFRYDTDAKKDATVEYPESKVVANVYVAPVGAVVSGGGVVPVMSASNLGDYKTTKDLVVVGGSAVNAVAADLLKVAYPTYGIDAAWTTATGVSENMALIKLFSGADKSFGTGKVALLVAGYEAKDTQAAAKALIAEKKFGLLSTTTASAYSYK